MRVMIYRQVEWLSEMAGLIDVQNQPVRIRVGSRAVISL